MGLRGLRQLNSALPTAKYLLSVCADGFCFQKF
jgi:hypothetical protein